MLERFEQLNVWTRGSERAPHKPLLVLHALARLSHGQESVPFTPVDEVVGALLREFGPPRKSYHPEYPFWRLQSDGMREIPAAMACPPDLFLRLQLRPNAAQAALPGYSPSPQVCGD